MGGVATGVAEHLGVPVLYVRVTFIVATWFHGVGVLAYLLLWRVLPLREPELSPGLESATRRGLRPGLHTGAFEVVQTVALGAVGVGVLVLIQAIFKTVMSPSFVQAHCAVPSAAKGVWSKQILIFGSGKAF